jgi:hypothetical protein
MFGTILVLLDAGCVIGTGTILESIVDCTWWLRRRKELIIDLRNRRPVWAGNGRLPWRSDSLLCVCLQSTTNTRSSCDLAIECFYMRVFWDSDDHWVQGDRHRRFVRKFPSQASSLNRSFCIYLSITLTLYYTSLYYLVVISRSAGLAEIQAAREKLGSRADKHSNYLYSFIGHIHNNSDCLYSSCSDLDFRHTGTVRTSGNTDRV